MLLSDSRHQIASDPGLVTSTFGSFGKNLILPLAFHDLAVDAFDIEPSRDARIEMLLHDLTT